MDLDPLDGKKEKKCTERKTAVSILVPNMLNLIKSTEKRH